MDEQTDGKTTHDSIASRGNTSSSAVAERPRALHVINYVAKSLKGHSRSFEMTLLSRACLSPY